MFQLLTKKYVFQQSTPSKKTAAEWSFPGITGNDDNKVGCCGYYGGSSADLLPTPADYGGFCDASKHGAGGVWFGLGKALPPVIWQVKFPMEIQAELVSQENPKGKITNSDLEMLGLFLQWLVLEKFAHLAHAHVAIWCNNMPTVAWASWLLATKAVKTAQILRMLAMRMMDCRVSPLTMLHILGTLNTMADFASRSFEHYPSSQVFLTEFNECFALPQNACWNLCLLPNATTGWANAFLSTTMSDLSTHAMRNCYWRHWCNFLPTSLDLYLQNVDEAARFIFIQVFAQQVCQGHCRRGHQVQASSIQTAIGAIRKTIRLAGFKNPLHWEGTTNYHAALKLQIESYKCGDPATKKQRAVLVAVPNCIFHATRNAADRHMRVVGRTSIDGFLFSHKGWRIYESRKEPAKDKRVLAAGCETVCKETGSSAGASTPLCRANRHHFIDSR